MTDFSNSVIRRFKQIFNVTASTNECIALDAISQRASLLRGKPGNAAINNCRKQEATDLPTTYNVLMNHY